MTDKSLVHPVTTTFVSPSAFWHPLDANIANRALGTLNAVPENLPAATDAPSLTLDTYLLDVGKQFYASELVPEKMLPPEILDQEKKSVLPATGFDFLETLRSGAVHARGRPSQDSTKIAEAFLLGAESVSDWADEIGEDVVSATSKNWARLVQTRIRGKKLNPSVSIQVGEESANILVRENALALKLGLNRSVLKRRLHLIDIPYLAVSMGWHKAKIEEMRLSNSPHVREAAEIIASNEASILDAIGNRKNYTTYLSEMTNWLPQTIAKIDSQINALPNSKLKSAVLKNRGVILRRAMLTHDDEVFSKLLKLLPEKIRKHPGYLNGQAQLLTCWLVSVSLK